MTLLPPPLDGNGEVVPHDHSGILPSDGVIRRISEQQIVIDDKIGGKRISSLAFKPSTKGVHGMSVDLQAQIEEAGHNAREYVSTPRWIGSVRFEAGALRAESFQVGCEPLRDNPFHGEVWGTFSKRKQRRLREICEWFVTIEDVSIV